MASNARPIRIEGDVAYIPLTKGYEAIIDATDVPLVGGRNWSASVRMRADGTIRTVYAVHNTVVSRRIKTTLLHRLIVGVDGATKVDHRDCDGLNNRSANLRVASNSENSRNSRVACDSKSGVKGVSWCATRQKWVVQITVHGKNFRLGRFVTLESAAAAYASAAVRLHGEFARAF